MKNYILKYAGAFTLTLSPVYGLFAYVLSNMRFDMLIFATVFSGACGAVLLFFHFYNGGK